MITAHYQCRAGGDSWGDDESLIRVQIALNGVFAALGMLVKASTGEPEVINGHQKDKLQSNTVSSMRFNTIKLASVVPVNSWQSRDTVCTSLPTPAQSLRTYSRVKASH